MTVLLTGSSGFVGQHYLKLMGNLSEPVVAVDFSPPKEYQHFKLPIEYITADLTDSYVVSRLFDLYKPTKVIHLAALSKVNSEDAITKNVKMTELVLSNCYKLIQQNRRVSVILAGSAAEYGDIALDFPPPNELCPLNPIEPYAKSKVLCSALADTYRTDFGVPVSVLRFANIYGPGQEVGRLIPNLIKAAVNGEPIILNDKGQPTRQWVYIDDVIYAINAAFKYLDATSWETFQGEDFNIGEFQEVSLRFLATIIMAEVQDQFLNRGSLPLPSSIQLREGNGGARRVAMDVTRAKLGLQWRSTVSLETGLRYTVQAFLEAQSENNTTPKDQRRIDFDANRLSRQPGEVLRELPHQGTD